MAAALRAKKVTQTAWWADRIPQHQWGVYARVLTLAQQERLPFALGGGLAFSHYSHHWRNTKDIDLYIQPKDRAHMIDITARCGLTDYFPVHDYDRSWIHRTYDPIASDASSHMIVDIIWQMANGRSAVDEQWLNRGDAVEVRGITLRIMAAEELIWTKLYVLQRDRSDWGDLLNVIHECGPSLDWAHLLTRVGEDRQLFAGLIHVYAWLCPGGAAQLSPALFEYLGMTRPAVGPAVHEDRVRLLDTRPWFGHDK